MTDITLQVGNANDFEEVELEELAIAVRDATGLDVQVTAREQRGYGVTWWEVVDFLMDESARYAIDAAIGAAVGWALKRLKRKKAELPENTWGPRPTEVRIIFGADGKPLKTVKIRDPDAEPEIKDGG